MFMVVGSEFRGFHLRFKDIARGGIRLIQSRTPQLYDTNLRSLFDENYNLAHTQQRKNKDIPEGGAKGAILMRSGATSAEAFVAFKKYVSALLDLLQPSPEIVDRLKAQEILFFGPDEGTAEFMDWASQAAKVCTFVFDCFLFAHFSFQRRGFPFWKALTTGKSPSLGGIPHDLYGMTTRSIHPYVLGVLEKLGLQESEVTKLQTGGPDGDLGSNEIKISKDKTIAIVDGSGVLYDPNGIDRPELLRLATGRKMIDTFDVARLGPDGFRVLVSEVNIRLPDGTTVPNGTNFRNNFHLSAYAAADIFVPCGGRPEAVSVSNVGQLYDPKVGAFLVFFFFCFSIIFADWQAAVQGRDRGSESVLLRAGSAASGEERSDCDQGRLCQQGRRHLVLL
jgi:glutamate dehydrogenase